MTRLLKLTLCACVALTPTLAAAQMQVRTAPAPTTAVPMVPLAQSAQSLTRTGGATHGVPTGGGVGSHSICGAGSQLHWQIIQPGSPPEPNGAQGYVLGCN
ncbi:hypothetical protein V8J82_03175 [Gymnodinialimonas sp. 2305UL16-5]|uniref:hypothetical protein n=1 Tax=Gymnodinialimonas mytili TaxID=3126503 RepID=UPI0030B26CC8